MTQLRPALDHGEGRDALLDVAARLFADEGVDAVSIRAVNRAAGLSPAAVHYHFGSKDGLLDAVLRRDGIAVAGRTAELTDILLARPEPPTARELVDVLGIPYGELLRRDPERGSRWLRIVAQLTMAGDTRVVDTALRPKLLALVRRTSPEASLTDISTMWALAVTTLIHMLGQQSQRSVGCPEQMCEALSDFVACGLDGALRSTGTR